MDAVSPANIIQYSILPQALDPNLPLIGPSIILGHLGRDLLAQ